MSWWGKVIGGGLGFLLGGPLGSALGVVVGHSFDKGLDQSFVETEDPSEQEKIQAAFFTATFTVMGRLAKADGVVTPNEIQAAKNTMARLGLNDALQKSAIQLFNQGKESGFDWKGAIEQFNLISGNRRNLKQMFLEIQIGAALADGNLKSVESEMLEVIAIKLGFGQLMLQKMIMMVQAQTFFHQQQQQQGNHSGFNHQVNPKQALEKAFQVLGVNAQATEDEVKKSYRKLMSQHHPDKLVAKGLPEEMIKAANQKTHEITAAYELIKKSREK